MEILLSGSTSVLVVQQRQPSHFEPPLIRNVKNPIF